MIKLVYKASATTMTWNLLLNADIKSIIIKPFMIDIKTLANSSAKFEHYISSIFINL